MNKFVKALKYITVVPAVVDAVKAARKRDAQRAVDATQRAVKEAQKARKS